MLSDVRRLLQLGSAIAVLIVALSIALELLADLGTWRTNAYSLLVVAALAFALLAIRVGNLLTESGATRAAYAERMARSVSQERQAIERPPLI